MLEVLLADYAIETLIIGAIFFILLIKQGSRILDWIKEKIIAPHVHQAQA